MAAHSPATPTGTATSPTPAALAWWASGLSTVSTVPTPATVMRATCRPHIPNTAGVPGSMARNTSESPSTSTVPDADGRSVGSARRKST